MPSTHADPQRRILSASMLVGYYEDGYPSPTCRVCGHALKIGDYVDPYHPYEHAGNLHQRCAADAPKPRGY